MNLDRLEYDLLARLCRDWQKEIADAGMARRVLLGEFKSKTVKAIARLLVVNQGDVGGVVKDLESNKCPAVALPKFRKWLKGVTA